METKELTKAVALKFLGNDPYVSEQFEGDLSPQPPIYVAPEIIMEISSYLRDVSGFFFNVLASLIAAFLFYKYQERKSRDDLERRLSLILLSYQPQIIESIKKTNELNTKLRKTDLRKIYVHVPPDMKNKMELRLTIYSDKLHSLENNEESSQTIVKIIEELSNKND